MTTYRAISSQAELIALRPVILEYFQYICAMLDRHHGVTVTPEDPVDAMFSKPQLFLPPIGHTLVAEDGDHIVATVSVKPLDATRVEIKRLYVRPEAQGRGLGRDLLEEAKRLARSMGAEEMYLDTLRSLDAAIALYRNDGFAEIPVYAGAEIGEHPDIIPHAIFMKRAL